MAFARTAQVADRLPGEDSPAVAQKDEERRSLQQRAERLRISEAAPAEGQVQCLGADLHLRLHGRCFVRRPRGDARARALR